MDRNEMRADLEHYQRLLIDAIRLDSREVVTKGYTPLTGALAMVVKWLKADRAGDYDAATVDAWWDASLLAAETWQEWELDYSHDFHKPLPELSGVGITEFSELILEAWDLIQRQHLAESSEKIIHVEEARWTA